jgi:CspA family cold shock protein
VRQTGTVKWFDEERGFGFVAQEDGEELFVHSTSVLVDASPALTQGQEVEFEVARTSRGAQAVDVVPLD